MKKHIQSYKDGDEKKYRPALIFLVIAFLILSAIGWGILQIQFFGAPLPIKIAKIFFLSIYCIIAGAILFAFYVLLKDSVGGEVVYVGIVTGKEDRFDLNVKGRGDMPMRFNFQLDDGKKFVNVEYKFYSQVDIGKQVEVHTTRFSGEILCIFTQ
ncbi:MAG TPA: hypothetical protein VNY36_09965 [Bacteroidia bacterium]|jgi:hypothetical protein|nr:hypothetical protein [Bacteroidia bacterium]